MHVHMFYNCRERQGENEKDYSHLLCFHNACNVLQSSLTETVSLAQLSSPSITTWHPY